MEKKLYKSKIKTMKGKYVTDVITEEKREIIQISTGKELNKLLKELCA